MTYGGNESVMSNTLGQNLKNIRFETEEEIVSKQICAQDHVLVDIDSESIWLKIYLKMICQDHKSY